MSSTTGAQTNAVTPQAARRLLAGMHKLPLAEKLALVEELEEYEHAELMRRCRTDFLAFCHHVYPNFKEGPHHRYLKPVLRRVMEGTELRTTVSMPPRFGKSETIAFLFVAWYLGHLPNHQVIMVTHTQSLSAGFGRKIRDLIDTPKYAEIFPETQVSKDKAASDNWTTTKGGKYLAIGTGANVAGYGADLLIVDDAVSEQSVLANPDTAFETAWNYIQVGPLQRLMPGGRIVMIGCMTAETQVLMADGAQKRLENIKVGDRIATYDNGVIATSRVTNWIKHHPDFVYRIRTTSGKIVRANKRHPFLVDRAGVRSWVRVRDLQVGDRLVETVSGPLKLKGYAPSATNASCMQTGAREHSPETGTGGSGVALSAPLKAARRRLSVWGFATVATAKLIGVLATTVSRWSKSGAAISNIDTAFLRKRTMLCWLRRAVVAPFASAHQLLRTQERDNFQSYTSTTATEQSECAGFCVTTAIWPSVTQNPRPDCLPLPNTYGVTTAAIVEISEDGFEPVFDMEVERTENFIANGVVSHNTRWGKRDPIGRALAWAKENPLALPWHEIRFPAILPSGKSLWPEQWPIDQLIAKKASMAAQYWKAQYDQEPTSEEGAIIKREWWRVWTKPAPPKVDFMIQSWDTAHETKSHNDYSANGTWGVFTNDETQRQEIILLNAFKGRWEFPDLKKKALETFREWEPECLIVEKKASGAPLIQELRAMGLLVEEFSPSRGKNGVSNDKRARLNAVSPIFADGMVWAPDRQWANEVVDECAEFPNGEHDDYVDMMTLAMMRYRKSGFMVLSDDAKDERDFAPRRVDKYY